MYFSKLYIENLIFDNKEFYTDNNSIIRDITRIKNEKFHKDIPINKFLN